MNPPTELGARSLFDGMPQSASVAGGDDDDLISALPDVLLHHVLGFLDAREAVRTCVVAKRWCHLWKSVPVLRVTCPGHVQSHREFLDHILLLLLRDRTNLEVCLFEFERYVPDDAPYLFLLIQHALLCQVRELSFTVSGTGLHGLWMQDLHVVSQHLTRLKLWGLLLPGKFLDFSSCPALHDLDMTDCDIHADKIYSRSLEHLSISGCTFCSDCWTLISTPSVISLQLHSCYGKHALSEDMPMLVSATVAMYVYSWCHHGYDNNTSCSRCYPTDDGSAGCVFLKGLSAARTLELIAEPGMFIFELDLRWCPTFSKLKSLSLSEWCVAGDHRALICILQHTPVLEMLTLQLYEETRNMVPAKAFYYLLDQPLPPENLQRVKLKCHEIDQRVNNILKFLITYGVPLGKISIQQENESSDECFNFICTGFGSIP